MGNFKDLRSHAALPAAVNPPNLESLPLSLGSRSQLFWEPCFVFSQEWPGPPAGDATSREYPCVIRTATQLSHTFLTELSGWMDACRSAGTGVKCNLPERNGQKNGSAPFRLTKRGFGL